MGRRVRVGPHRPRGGSLGAGHRSVDRDGGDGGAHAAAAAGDDGHAARAASAVEGRARGGRRRRAVRRALHARGRPGRGPDSRVRRLRRGPRPAGAGRAARRGSRDPRRAVVRASRSPSRARTIASSGAHFLPRPVQQPRVPIWVAGRWPNRRPFRRAARWDGVFPVFEGVAAGEMPTPETLAAAVDVHARAPARRRRSVRRGARERQRRARTARPTLRLAADYERAGLTWWIEALGWFRGPLETMRERVRRGPP